MSYKNSVDKLFEKAVNKKNMADSLLVVKFSNFIKNTIKSISFVIGTLAGFSLIVFVFFNAAHLNLKTVGNSMMPTMSDGSAHIYMPFLKLNRGDIVAYRMDKGLDVNSFVKRVVGLPGDRISYFPNERLLVNHDNFSYIVYSEELKEELKREVSRDSKLSIKDIRKLTYETYGLNFNFHLYYGNQFMMDLLKNDVHLNFLYRFDFEGGFYNYEIPDGYYFLVGDASNTINFSSKDSMEIGPVHISNIYRKRLCLSCSFYDLEGFKYLVN